MSYEARMKEWITDHDIRQKTLAKEFHITEAALSHYMTGRSEVSVDVLVKFAKYAGLSMDYLVGLSDEPLPAMRLTTPERQFVEELRTLSYEQRELVAKIITAMQEQNQRKHS